MEEKKKKHLRFGCKSLFVFIYCSKAYTRGRYQQALEYTKSINSIITTVSSGFQNVSIAVLGNQLVI